MIEQTSFSQEGEDTWKRWDRRLMTLTRRGWEDDSESAEIQEITARLVHGDGRFLESGTTLMGNKGPLYFVDWMPTRYRKEGAIFDRIVSPDAEEKPIVGSKKRWNGWDAWVVRCRGRVRYYEDSSGWLVGETDLRNDTKILIESNTEIPQGTHTIP